MSTRPLAASLRSLMEGDQRAAHEVAQTLARLIVDRAAKSTTRTPISIATALTIAQAVTAWHVHGKCPKCEGRGFQAHGHRQCSACKGTRKRPLETEFPETWRETVRWAAARLEQ